MALENGVVSKPIMKTKTTYTFNDCQEMAQREELLRTGNRSDIEFDVGSENRKTFRAHRLYLLVGSDKFAKMLDLNLDSTSFRIPEIEPKLFEQLLK